jgi:hypothetical protein
MAFDILSPALESLLHIRTRCSYLSYKDERAFMSKCLSNKERIDFLEMEQPRLIADKPCKRLGKEELSTILRAYTRVRLIVIRLTVAGEFAERDQLPSYIFPDRIRLHFETSRRVRRPTETGSPVLSALQSSRRDLPRAVVCIGSLDVLPASRLRRRMNPSCMGYTFWRSWHTRLRANPRIDPSLTQQGIHR